MSKPSLPTFDASNTIEDLNTALDTLASKFDAALDDSDISSVSYSKLTLGGNIVNADISNSAGITGTKLADDTIAAVKLNNSIINYAKLASGAANKLQVATGTETLTSYSSATETDLTDDLSVTGPEASTKILCFGFATFRRGSNSGTCQLGISIDGTTFTPKGTMSLSQSNEARTVTVMANGTVGTSPIVVKLVANSDGTLQINHTVGEAFLVVLMLKRAD